MDHLRFLGIVLKLIKVLHIFNQTTQMTQVIILDSSLREKVHAAVNGVKYKVYMSAMNSQGESPRTA